MARIKTALELAMEKMENIQVDESKIRRENTRQQARTIAGRFLEDDRVTDEELASQLAAFTPENLPLVKQTINNTILQNLTLPGSIEYKVRTRRIQSLFGQVNPEDQQAQQIVDQVIGLEGQYWDNMSGLLDNLKEQYKDALAQSDLPPEQNKDFLKLYQANVNKMNQQFNAVMTQAKGQLRELLGLEEN